MKFFAWTVVLLLTFLPWGGLLLEEPLLESLFVHGAYWILTAYLLGLLIALGVFCHCERLRLFSFLRHRSRLLIGSLTIALLLSTMIVSSHDVFFKTLSDETNLLSVSRSLLVQKQAYNITEGMHYYQNFNISAQTLPKRPLLFPYLTHLLHLTSGYHWQHPFWLNQFALLGLIWTLVFALGLRHQAGLGVGIALIVVSSPLLGIQATSAGFDFFSTCWLWFTVFVLGLGLGTFRASQQSSKWLLGLGLWWALGFVQIRYENAYLALVALACYLVLRGPGLLQSFRKNSGRERLGLASLLVMGSWLLALSQWQVLLSGGKFVERPDQTLLAVKHLPDNLNTLLSTLLDPTNWGDRIVPPYRPLLWLALLLGLSWVLTTGWSPQTSLLSRAQQFLQQLRVTWRTSGLRAPVAALGALLTLLTAQQLIYLLHFFGIATHPSSARFFLPLTLLGSLALGTCCLLLPRRYRSSSCLLSGLLLCLLYLPQSQQGRFINQLTLNRETRFIHDLVLADPARHVLYIHDRPGQIVILDRGAVSVQTAQRQLKHYQKNLQQGLIKDLIYLHRSDTAKANVQQLLRQGDWIEHQRFMISPERELVVMHHRNHLPEPRSADPSISPSSTE